MQIHGMEYHHWAQYLDSFVDCSDSMCLYILKRNKYIERLETSKGLFKLTSDELFNELRDELTWIPIKYGQVLAFDRHSSRLLIKCGSKFPLVNELPIQRLHTPYWDKKLGEYFMPITVKKCTRLGMNYKHPRNWLHARLSARIHCKWRIQWKSSATTCSKPNSQIILRYK